MPMPMTSAGSMPAAATAAGTARAQHVEVVLGHLQRPVRRQRGRRRRAASRVDARRAGSRAPRCRARRRRRPAPPRRGRTACRSRHRRRTAPGRSSGYFLLGTGARCWRGRRARGRSGGRRCRSRPAMAACAGSRWRGWPTAVKSWRTVVSGGIEVRRLGDVVEADDADVAGTVQPGLGQRAQHARAAIWSLAHEDRGHLVAPGQSPGRPRSRCAAVQSPSTCVQRPQPGGVHRLLPARQAGPRPRSRSAGPPTWAMSVWPRSIRCSGGQARRRRPGRRRPPSASRTGRPRPRSAARRRSSWARATARRLVGGGDQHDALDALVAQVVDGVAQLLARSGRCRLTELTK